MTLRLISFLGLFAMILLAWLMSPHKRKLAPRMIAGGLLLQFAFAALMLKTTPGMAAFDGLSVGATKLLGFVDEASRFMFGVESEVRPGDRSMQLLSAFAFKVLPAIVFFSALMSLLYHIGVMQLVIKAVAWVMQRTLGVSGAESVAAAANVLVGHTEAPLVVRPFLATMTLSELNALLVGGFATISSGIMAVYIDMGISAGHLLTASVISAPAALLIAKVMLPETETPQTLGTVRLAIPRVGVNAIEAIAIGASDGLKLAVNVGAMLIAFLALLAMADAFVVWVGGLFSLEWSLADGLGYLFSPIAWLMGIETRDCPRAGEILGLKTMANEFIAYQRLAEWMEKGDQAPISERTHVILTYALCGFANFGSIGIAMGGIGALAPERRADLARLGLRAMIGGALACFMTGCVAGVLT
jgi:CNT family concentrative nucleoside transporter